MTKKKSFDIIIVGGGMVGATLALALAKQTRLSIAILEAQSAFTPWNPAPYHHRVSAIALSSKRIFQKLNVWDAMNAMRISPFTNINVWDALNREADIAFDSKEITASALGYIIENAVIQTALMEKIMQSSSIQFISSARLASVTEHGNEIAIATEDAHTFTAKLAIAADGANSWLREKANILLHQEDYQQHAIVATVRTKVPHEKIARQVFLATGPLAFLPLAEPNLVSIVWSLPVNEATRLFALDKQEFMRELSLSQLGEVIAVEERHVFPLYKQQTEQYVKSRVVLVGDAAHTLHPLAGQGANIGLLDAASLAEVIADAVNKHRDFASATTLRRYERWRRADNLAMLAGVDFIKQLFANEKKPIQQLRSLGLAMTNKLPWLKNQFIRHAVGIRDDLPKLAR